MARRKKTERTLDPQALANILTYMYDNAADKNITAMIQLFGIKYAEEIKRSGATAADIVRLSKLRDSYDTEVTRGIRLAPYVTIKPGALPFLSG